MTGIGHEHKAPLQRVVTGTSRRCAICGQPRDALIGEELQTVCCACIARGRQAREVRGIAFVTDTLRKISRCEKYCDASCGKCRIAAEHLVEQVEKIALALNGCCITCGDDRDHPVYCKTCAGGFIRMALAGETLPEDAPKPVRDGG